MKLTVAGARHRNQKLAEVRGCRRKRNRRHDGKAVKVCAAVVMIVAGGRVDGARGH